MATVTTEVRPGDGDGKLWLWEVTTSDVPGEGGAKRLGEVTLVSCTTHELAVRTEIAAVEDALSGLRAKLDEVLQHKAAIEAAATGGG